MNPFLNIGKRGPRPRINAIANRNLLRALVDGPCTYAELAGISGLSLQSVRTYIRHMRSDKPNHLVHVCGHLEAANGARIIQQFRWNPGARDVTNPAYTAAERCKRLRERQQRSLLAQCAAGQTVSSLQAFAKRGRIAEQVGH